MANQLLKSWSQTQATQYNRLTGTAWGADYGQIGGSDPDANGTSEDVVLFKKDHPKWKSWNLTNVTRKWHDGTATNYGVLIWATNEDTDGYDIRFRHSEYGTSSDHPYLEITYSEDLKTVYFLKDHLGSIRATVDAETDTVVGYDDYDAWGYILAGRSMTTPWSSVQGTAKNKFTGKEWDDEFGLDWNYFGARYYDPEVGRFLSIDPLLEKHPDFTPYHYTLNNPLRFIDPDGKQVEATGGQAGLAQNANPLSLLVTAFFEVKHSIENILLNSFVEAEPGMKFQADFAKDENGNLIFETEIKQIPSQGAIVDAIGVGLNLVNVASGGKNPAGSLLVRGSKTQLTRGVRSLTNRINEHRQKLDAFIKNPEAFDNKNILKNAPSKKIRQKIIQGRIKKLKNEIETFKNERQQLQNELKKRD